MEKKIGRIDLRAVGKAVVAPAEVIENFVIPDIPCNEENPSSGTRDDPLTNCSSL